MKKSKKYLELYKECLETGRMPAEGLCVIYGINDQEYHRHLMLFRPYTSEFKELHPNGHHYLWGSGLDCTGDWRTCAANTIFKFTPLRQTILLFIIEMTKDYERQQRIS